MAGAGVTVRDMLVEAAPPTLRAAGHRLLAAERAVAAGGDDGAGLALATAIADWADLGGYDLEQRWDAAAQRVVGAGLGEVGERRRRHCRAASASGWCWPCCSARTPTSCCSTSPTTTSTSRPGPGSSELQASRKTVLMISHDRTLLANVATRIVTLEGSAAWVHGGSYATYAEARERRQRLLGDDLERWNDEERRLFRHMKIMKQRPAATTRTHPRPTRPRPAGSGSSAQGPPPPPVPPQQIKVRLAGADSARRVVRLTDLAVDGLFEPFSDDIFFGERIGLVGSNGTGKTHLLDALADPGLAHEGAVTYGPRTSVGRFTQVNDRPDFRGRPLLDIVVERVGEEERSMKALARYGLVGAARRVRVAVGWAEGQARGSCASTSRATTCCCSTSPPTTSTSSRPRRWARPRRVRGHGRGGVARPGLPGPHVAVPAHRRRRRRVRPARLRRGHHRPRPSGRHLRGRPGQAAVVAVAARRAARRSLLDDLDRGAEGQADGVDHAGHVLGAHRDRAVATSSPSPEGRRCRARPTPLPVDEGVAVVVRPGQAVGVLAVGAGRIGRLDQVLDEQALARLGRVGPRPTGA